MKIACSWCKKFIGETDRFDDPSEIHAKCPACVQKQKHDEERANTAEDGKTITLENGLQGLITIGGKETPNLRLGDVFISGKMFLCDKKERAKVVKHLESLKGDEVDYTFLHSSKIEIPRTRRGRKNKDEPEEKPKEPTNYNCTIHVSKTTVLSWFDANTAHFEDVYGKLAEMLADAYLKDRIAIDKDLFLLSPMSADIPNLLRLLKDKVIYDNTLEIPYPYTKKDAQTFLETCSQMKGRHQRPMIWAIRTGNEGLIGVIGFKDIPTDQSKIEIGYWLGKPYWNQGIMTKVLMKVTDKGLKEYGFKRIEMCVFASNDASCRVAEKCDYKFERIVPCAHQKAGRSIDAKLYAAMSTPT